jgi:hypothetical protein
VAGDSGDGSRIGGVGALSLALSGRLPPQPSITPGPTFWGTTLSFAGARITSGAGHIAAGESCHTVAPPPPSSNVRRASLASRLSSSSFAGQRQQLAVGEAPSREAARNGDPRRASLPCNPSSSQQHFAAGDGHAAVVVHAEAFDEQ